MSFFTALGICTAATALIAIVYGGERRVRHGSALFYTAWLFGITGMPLLVAILTAMAAVKTACALASRFYPVT